MAFYAFLKEKTKAVTLSYDDAFRADIRLANIMTSYDIKGTFNINSRWMDKDDVHLTSEEVAKYILGQGHEVAVHGAEHIALGKARPLDGIREVLNCRMHLEKTFGRIIRGLAYADSGIRTMSNGASYENIRQYLQDLDIAYARTLGSDSNTFEMPTDWYAWMPTVYSENPRVLEYAKEFVELDVNQEYPSSRWPRLFCVWGHSYEFERGNKWELIDELCQVLAHHKDTWYATNMEIYDYVKAYESLVFSADNSMVHNPSLVTVWFDIDRVLYEIASGETIILKGI